MKPAPGEKYTLRRKVFSFLGAKFHLYDSEGKVVGFCKQKAFKLKEDIRVYTDDSMSAELLRIAATKVIDFGASYTISLPDGSPLGSLRRKGLKSLLRDTWVVFDASGSQVATLTEDSGMFAILRRAVDLFALIVPQKFVLIRDGGEPVATLRTHFNPFVYRLGITIHRDDPVVDELMVLAAACLVGAIEGRQG